MVLWLRQDRRSLWSILAALATLLLTLLLTGRQTRPTAVDGEISSPGTVIVLDAGHGGEDGAPCPRMRAGERHHPQIVRKAKGLFVFLGRSVRLTLNRGGGHLFSGGTDPAGEESIGPEEPCGAYQRPAPMRCRQHPSEQ
ncbi:MAG: hypothetical protein ACLU38_09345 [Dysosmobacter sp.]